MGKEKSDLDLIEQTVQDYFQGMYHSDTARLKKAFHANAFLMGYFNGKITRIALDDWLGMIAKTPAPAGKGEVYDMKIVSADMTENVAAVKVSDLYLGLRFTDYLSLVKLEDGWKIVHKSFHHAPKS
jgi:hypothetical protein